MKRLILLLSSMFFAANINAQVISDSVIGRKITENMPQSIYEPYVTKNILLPRDPSALRNMDTGMKWTFFNDQAEIILKGTDLYSIKLPGFKMMYHTQELRLNKRPDSREISLSLTFKFGD